MKQCGFMVKQEGKEMVNHETNEGRMENKIRLGEILYWVFWCSILFAKGLGLYDGQKSFKVILVIATICLIYKICIEEYTMAEYAYVAVIVGITAITYLASGEKGLLLYGMMIVGMKNVDLKRLFRIGTVIWGIAFCSITVASLFHMEDTVYKIHSKLGMGHIFRWSLGYPHPNVLHVSYLVLAMFVIYVLEDNFKLRHGATLLLGNCLVFLYSVSYTGFIIVSFLLCGRVYLLWRKKLCVGEKILIQMFFPLCVFGSIAAPVLIKGELFLFLNDLLSTRMELAWRYLKPEYISLFGIRVAEITTERLTMDNSYLFALITYGVIPFLVICVATIYMIYRYLKMDKYIEVLLMLAIALGGITEPFLYNTSFKNLSFLFMGTLFFNIEFSMKRWVILPNRNKFLNINMKGIERGKEIIKVIGKVSFTKIMAGFFGGILMIILANCLVTYPSGYVFYRTDCSDLTKNKNYYQESDERYFGYRRMGEFEDGDEVEFFSGNIVKVEKVRCGVSSVVLGFGCGYAVCGIICLIYRKKRELGQYEK